MKKPEMRIAAWPDYQRLLRGCGLMLVLLIAYMMAPAPAMAEGLSPSQIQQAAATACP